MMPLSQTTLFGTGYVEAGCWLVKRGWVTTRDGGRYNTIIENRPDFKPVNFFEVYPHPAKMDVDDGLPLIRRRFVDAEYLKRLKENVRMKIENIDKAIESENPQKSELGQAYQAKSGEEYELLEYWGPWDEEYKEGDKDCKRLAVPYWITVVNRSVTIRNIPNPYDHQIPPICKMTLYEDTKPSWFGVGIGKIGKPTQDRLNKIVNQRLNNVDLVLNKQGCYMGSDPLINVKKLQVSKPGAFHKVSDTVNSIRWIDTPDVTQSSYKEEELAKQDYRESTGATAHLMPEAGSEHRTAMGIQLLQGAAGMRFRPILRKLESALIQQTAMFFFSNLKQFMTTAQWVQITGKTGTISVNIKPEEIQSKVYFIPTGVSETMNKETQVQQLLRFKELTAQDPTVNRQEINKRVAELMGFKDIQSLLIVPQATMPSEGALDLKTQQFIQQRLQEGATPDQIKEELLGAKPPGMDLTGQTGVDGGGISDDAMGPPNEADQPAPPSGPRQPMMAGQQ
jgi:hypothetical protein